MGQGCRKTERVASLQAAQDAINLQLQHPFQHRAGIFACVLVGRLAGGAAALRRDAHQFDRPVTVGIQQFLDIALGREVQHPALRASLDPGWTLLRRRAVGKEQPIGMEKISASFCNDRMEGEESPRSIWLSMPRETPLRAESSRRVHPRRWRMPRMRWPGNAPVGGVA